MRIVRHGQGGFFERLCQEVAEFAESHFRLNRKTGGVSERDTLEQVAKTLGQEPAELQDLPELPECASHVWRWWQQLSATRQCGMSINPISEPSIGWYFRTRRIQPLAWELDAIAIIETAFLNDYHESQPKPKKP